MNLEEKCCIGGYTQVNNYPSWWNSTITLYNKYVDKTTNAVYWYKTTLKNCFWNPTGVKVIIGTTSLDTSSTLCRIPKSSNFLGKAEWDASVSKQMFFTLAPGDILVYGVCTDTIDEYTKGNRSSDFLQNHRSAGDCMLVEQVHIAVGGGRGNEHYRVEGK